MALQWAWKHHHLNHRIPSKKQHTKPTASRGNTNTTCFHIPTTNSHRHPSLIFFYSHGCKETTDGSVKYYTFKAMFWTLQTLPANYRTLLENVNAANSWKAVKRVPLGSQDSCCTERAALASQLCITMTIPPMQCCLYAQDIQVHTNIETHTIPQLFLSFFGMCS